MSVSFGAVLSALLYEPLDQPRPPLEIGLDEVRKLLRRADERGEALPIHGLLAFLRADDADDLRVKLRDDLPGRLGGRENAVPRRGFKAPQADFRDRRNVGHLWPALRRVDGQGAQFARPD